MRSTRLVIALALILAGAACDTEQPTDAGEQIVTITVEGRATVQKWNVWDVWIDVDGNCEINEPPDFEASFKFCEELTGPQNAVGTLVPWRYSAELAVIRAGTTQEELVATSIGTANQFSNLSYYDVRVFQPLADRPCSGTPNGLLSVNGRQVSAANFDVLDGCIGADGLLPANVLGQPGQYDVAVRQGDTVVFRARKGRTDKPSQANPYVGILEGEVEQSARMYIDGVEIEPLGDPSTGSDEGGGISISTRLR